MLNQAKKIRQRKLYCLVQNNSNQVVHYNYNFFKPKLNSAYVGKNALVLKNLNAKSFDVV